MLLIHFSNVDVVSLYDSYIIHSSPLSSLCSLLAFVCWLPNFGLVSFINSCMLHILVCTVHMCKDVRAEGVCYRCKACFVTSFFLLPLGSFLSLFLL